MYNPTIVETLLDNADAEEQASLITLEAFRAIYKRLTHEQQTTLLKLSLQHTEQRMEQLDRPAITDIQLHDMTTEEHQQYIRTKNILRPLCTKFRQISRHLAYMSTKQAK